MTTALNLDWEKICNPVVLNNPWEARENTNTINEWIISCESLFTKDYISMCTLISESNKSHIIRSNESGFLDKVKNFGKRFIEGFLKVLKAIIVFTKGVILKIATFIRDKIIHKIFGSNKKSNEEIKQWIDEHKNDEMFVVDNDQTTEALDKEGLNLCVISNDLAFLLRNQKFDAESIDRLLEISNYTFNAAEAMQNNLALLIYNNNSYIRTGGIQLNSLAEKDFIKDKYKSNKDKYSSKEGMLNFVHELRFTEWLQMLNKICNNKLSHLISDNNRINIPENITGSDLAKSVILNRSITKLNNTKNNFSNNNYLKLLDVIDDDFLYRLMLLDKNIIIKLYSQAEQINKINDNIRYGSEIFYEKLSDEYKKQINNDKVEYNYGTLTQWKNWIIFFTQFNLEFFKYQMELVKIFRAIKTKQLYDNEIMTKDKYIYPINGVIHNTALGTIELIKDNDFLNIIKSSDFRYIVSLKKYFDKIYNTKIPVYIIPLFKLTNMNSHATTETIFDCDNIKFSNDLLKYLCNYNGNEVKCNTYINNYYSDILTYFSSSKFPDLPKYIKKILKPSFCILKINMSEQVRKSKLPDDMEYKYSIKLFSDLVHEYTHIKELNYIKSYLDDSNIIKSYYEKKTQIEDIKNNYGPDNITQKGTKIDKDYFKEMLQNMLYGNLLIEKKAFDNERYFLKSILNQIITNKNELDKLLKNSI